MSLVFIKFWNSMEVNCGPVSKTNGRPFPANAIRRISIVFVAVILFIGKTSGHLECTSTTIRNCFSTGEIDVDSLPCFAWLFPQVDGYLSWATFHFHTTPTTICHQFHYQSPATIRNFVSMPSSWQ